MKFWHNGVLTSDIDKTIDFLCAASGQSRDKWTIMDLEFPDEHITVGKGGKLRAAFGRVGGVVVELLQPLDNDSYHALQLKNRGPGFHHNAYICEENMDATVNSLLNAGGRIVWEFLTNDERACYVEEKNGNAILEIINCCPFMPEE